MTIYTSVLNLLAKFAFGGAVVSLGGGSDRFYAFIAGGLMLQAAASIRLAK